MLNGQETVQIAVEIACGELRWEGARQHAGRDETVERNSLRRASLGGSETACWTDRKPCLRRVFCWEERYSMLDGQESTEIACRELRWQGARQHAGRRGNGANSLHTMETFGT